MARKASSKPDSGSSSTATIGFEATALRGSANPPRAAILRSPQGNRWLTADTALRDSATLRCEANLRSLSEAKDNRSNNMDAADWSGATKTATGSPQGERGGAEQYKAENVFWVLAEARWSHLQASAKQPVGKVEVRMQKEESRRQLPTSSFPLPTWPDAMVAIERDNPRLKGVLPKDYAWPGLDTARRDSARPKSEASPQSLSASQDNQRLGELIDVIATIELTAASEGDKTHRSVDLLGRVYDWSGARKPERSGDSRACFPQNKAGQTAKGSPQGERGGVHQFYTPSCVVRCLVEMLAPYTALRGSAFLQSEASPQVVSAAKDNGRIYDPACGSGGIPRHSESRSEAETASRRLPAGRAQRGNFVESHGDKRRFISDNALNFSLN